MKIGVLILKIILINPSPTVEIENRNNKIVKRQNTYPPLGLLYLGEILSREGHNVKILDQDVTGASPAQILESIKKFDPNIVGLSPLSPSFNISMEIAKLIKNWNPNINLIVGNILATLCSDLILKDYPFVDYCVRGEAEKPLPNLIDVIEKNKLDELENVRGITFRKDNKIKMTPNAKPIKDLDEIPFPDRNLIDYNYTMSGKKFTILATSRGCPFNCKFCGIHINSGLKGVLRVRSLKNVIDELNAKIAELEKQIEEQSYYVVKPGDWLSKLAEYPDVYGHGNYARWREIYKANKDLIQDPDLILPGWKLKIPRP